MKFDTRYLTAFLFFAVVMSLLAFDRTQTEAIEARRVEADLDRLKIEQADFMLKCVHDFGVRPDECRAILEGEDPKPYEEGC